MVGSGDYLARAGSAAARRNCHHLMGPRALDVAFRPRTRCSNGPPGVMAADAVRQWPSSDREPAARGPPSGVRDRTTPERWSRQSGMLTIPLLTILLIYHITFSNSRDRGTRCDTSELIPAALGSLNL